jgi:hypothetical protein
MLGFLCTALGTTWADAEPAHFYRLERLSQAPDAERVEGIAIIDKASLRIARPPDVAEFELPGGVVLTLRKQWSASRDRAGGFAWVGTPDGSPPVADWALVSLVDDQLVATIYHGTEVWELRPPRSLDEPTSLRRRPPASADRALCATAAPSEPAQTEVHAPESATLQRVADDTAQRWRMVPNLAGGGADSELRFGETLQPPSRARANSDAADAYTYDVLILYTPATAFWAGSSLVPIAQHMVDYANAAYANSWIPVRARIAAFRQIQYAETGYLSVDLQWLKRNRKVVSMKRSVGADIAYMLVNGAFDAMGMAGLPIYQRPASLKPEAFAVGIWNGDELLLAHEIGHNFGAQHDPLHAAPPSQNMFPYGYGYYRDGVFRTVMSYFDQCYYGCPAIPAFSTPYTTYAGYPVGVEFVYENARVLAYNSFLISNLINAAAAPKPARRLTATPSGSGVVTLQWRDRSQNEDGFAVFVSDLYRWHFLGVTAANTTSVPISGLSPGLTYEFEVYAWREAGGFSPSSGSVRAVAP